MSPIFTINFRRDAHRRELSGARARAAALGAWVAYFGVLAIVIGLDGLNGHSLGQRARMLEAQIHGLGAARVPVATWTLPPAELAKVEAALDNPRRWQSRLQRIAAVLPSRATLTALVVNPENVSGLDEQDRLVMTGVFAPAGDQDRMQGIMQLVAALRADSLLASQYRVIKLVESRVGGPGSPAEFRIECRR